MNFRETTVAVKTDREGNKEGYVFKTRDSNFNSAEQQTAYEWADRFEDAMTVRIDGNLVMNKPLMNDLMNDYNSLINELTEAVKNGFWDESYRSRAAEIIEGTGLSLSIQAFEYWTWIQGR